MTPPALPGCCRRASCSADGPPAPDRRVAAGARGVEPRAPRGVDDGPVGRPGQFVLTGLRRAVRRRDPPQGSAGPHRLRMRPMALVEAGRSTGDASLAALLAGEAPRAVDPGLDIRDIASLVAVGGWPALLGRPVDEALAAVRGYLDETRRADLARAGRRRGGTPKRRAASSGPSPGYRD